MRGFEQVQTRKSSLGICEEAVRGEGDVKYYRPANLLVIKAGSCLFISRTTQTRTRVSCLFGVCQRPA